MKQLFSLKDIIEYISLNAYYYTGFTYKHRNNYMGFNYEINMTPKTCDKLQLYTSRIEIANNNNYIGNTPTSGENNLIQGWRNIHHKNIRIDIESYNDMASELIITWVPHDFYTNCFVTDFYMLSLMTMNTIETYRENTSH